MAIKQIVSPEGRFWEGAGPNGEDVVMLTGKHYPETIVKPEFLARLLEDGVVTHIADAPKAAPAPAEKPEDKGKEKDK